MDLLPFCRSREPGPCLADEEGNRFLGRCASADGELGKALLGGLQVERLALKMTKRRWYEKPFSVCKKTRWVQ
jgi:hypothetical protein